MGFLVPTLHGPDSMIIALWTDYRRVAREYDADLTGPPDLAAEIGAIYGRIMDRISATGRCLAVQAHAVAVNIASGDG